MAENSEQKSLVDRLGAIRLIAMDVDGVLTDGCIRYVESDSNSADALELKTFNVQDGLGIRLLQFAGIHVAWITGRASRSIEKRAKELHVGDLYQRSGDKRRAIQDLQRKWELKSDQIAYIGDDLNDLPAFQMAGIGFAPANAVNDIKASVDFVTEKAGGAGAVREVCDMILKVQGKWNDAVTKYLNQAIQSSESLQ